MLACVWGPTLSSWPCAQRQPQHCFWPAWAEGQRALLTLPILWPLPPLLRSLLPYLSILCLVLLTAFANHIQGHCAVTVILNRIDSVTGRNSGVKIGLCLMRENCLAACIVHQLKHTHMRVPLVPLIRLPTICQYWLCCIGCVAPPQAVLASCLHRRLLRGTLHVCASLVTES